MIDLTSPIGEVVVILADASHESRGLLAWVSCTYAGLRIDHITIRRRMNCEDPTASVYVTFPAKPLIGGERRFYIRPMSPEVHQRFEAVIVAEYLRRRARFGPRGGG